LATILGQTRKRDEICLSLGFAKLSKDADQNFAVKLNPPRNEKITLTANNFLVILAEDELKN
jgi:hypothetical protein